MPVQQDNTGGIVSITWNEIRQRVQSLEPTFSRIVDQLAPDHTLPLYLVHYPFGALLADQWGSLFSQQEGKRTDFSETTPTAELQQQLTYGQKSIPLGLVLEKNIEAFIDFNNDNRTIPWAIYSPGSFIAVADLFSENTHCHKNISALTFCSGARSAFMLPQIGCLSNHINLQREFKVDLPAPKSMYDHWSIFKKIAVHNATEVKWASCVLYFSEKWRQNILYDSAWSQLRVYLQHIAWQQSEHERHRIHYQIAFSMIQKRRNLRPNPYLVDTAYHLFMIALGAAPGYAPAMDDAFLPLNFLQKTFVELYGLKKYSPIVLQPTVFDLKQHLLPVYYSLQNPSTPVFSPKSREMSSVLYELHELEHIIRILLSELEHNHSAYPEILVQNIARAIQFRYFHNQKNRSGTIQSSQDMLLYDERFQAINAQWNLAGTRFASDARFLRGCISINAKETS